MIEQKKKPYIVSDDKVKLDIALIHEFLSAKSYWAKNIPLDLVKRSIENSMCFGVYSDTNAQIAFARVITDYATFAYLADVFVIESERGEGISKELMRYIMNHEQLQGLRRWVLATRDAQGLYAQFGFEQLPNPQNFMTIAKPEMYSGIRNQESGIRDKPDT